jgi:hypothetical protein
MFPFVFVQPSASTIDYQATLITFQSFGGRIVNNSKSYLLDQERG